MVVHAEAATLPASPVLSLDSLPRPPIHSLAGWIAFWTNPEFARRQMQKLGERVVLDIPFLPTMLFTSSVEDCTAIFTERDGALEFNEALRRIAPHERVLGKELIDWLGGEIHPRIRRLVMPAFMGSAVQGYEEAMAQVAREHAARWPVDEPVSFSVLAKDLARDVIMSVVFGVTEPGRRERLTAALTLLDSLASSRGFMARYVASHFARGRWLPYPKLDRINAEIDAIIFEEIDDRRANPSGEEGKDCLSIFLRLQQQEGDGGLLTTRMIVTFQRFLLLAGYETTAVTLAWLVERVVRHPDVLAKLDDAVAGGDDSYLDAVITESMRVRPALPVTVRSVEKDCVINGVAVPKGALIMLYINAIQKRPDLYDAPEKFDPERFVGKRANLHHWLPFGGGAHRCLGAHFSMVEARVLIRTILQDRAFAPDYSPDERQDQHHGILTTPGDGAMVTIRRRPE